MKKFNISIDKNGADIFINENMREQDIIELLKFDESIIEELLLTHAANQAYWEALSIRLKNKYEYFKDSWYKKWWSYNKVYAKYVLAEYGDSKPTVDSINDMTIIMYSSDRSDFEREKYCDFAHSYYLRKFRSDMSRDWFHGVMYKYLIDYPNPWYFEILIDTLNKYKEDYEIVEVVAEKLNSRSFHMQNVLELMKAKYSNIGPMSVQDKYLMGKVSDFKKKKEMRDG